MVYTDAKGNTFTKRFILNAITMVLALIISEKLPPVAEVQFYGQLKHNFHCRHRRSNKGARQMSSAFHGAAYSSADHRYEKVKFGNMNDAKLDVATPAGWAGMLQHYFVAAWTGKPDAQNHIYGKAVNVNADVKDSGEAIIGIKLPVTTVAANAEAIVGTSLWIGPKLQDQMAAVAQHLDLTVDYGYLWFIAQPLFQLLQFLHGLVGNWGVAIILITMIVRGVMYPLSKAQYTSMAKCACCSQN